MASLADQSDSLDNQSDSTRNSSYSLQNDLDSLKKNVDIFFLVVMGSIVFCKYRFTLSDDN